MPNSRFALHGRRPSLIHGLCAFFASNSHGLCAFFRLLLTPLSTAPSPPPSQFTVCTSRFARLRFECRKSASAGEIQKGREEGDGTENVINCRDVCRKLS